VAKRTGRKLACGAALIGGLAFGAVATAAPASAPEAASVRAQAASRAAVVDLAGLDAAVDAARLAQATTVTNTTPAEPTTTTDRPGRTTTTTTTVRARTAATPAAPAPAPAPPAPEPAPAPTSSAERAIAHWFPDVYDAAVSVAWCESNMDPGAVSSGGGNHGLFQINSLHRSSFESVTGRPWSDVYDADANARFARHLYDGSGWGPWTCKP
jgi:Lysozyme like domain